MALVSLWECGHCSRSEDDESIRIRWACHHCGKLLCEKDKRVIIDVAFAGSIASPTRRAVHCPSCLKEHHAVLYRLVRS